jgi:hypothetical protein
MHADPVGSLATALQLALERGSASSPPLKPSYTTGARQWVEWHERLRPEVLAARSAPAPAAAKPTCRRLEVVALKEQQEAVPLRDSVCRHGGDPSDNVLLLPSHFSFDASSAAWREVCPLMDNLEGSVAFGARLPGSGETLLMTMPLPVIGPTIWAENTYSQSILCEKHGLSFKTIAVSNPIPFFFLYFINPSAALLPWSQAKWPTQQPLPGSCMKAASRPTVNSASAVPGSCPSSCAVAPSAEPSLPRQATSRSIHLLL